MSVAGAMIAGEVYGGSGNDSVMLGGSLGGVVSLAHGADSLIATAANAATVLGGTENDTFTFTGAVRDSSLVGGFGVDSITATGQLRGSTIWGGDPSNGGSPIDGADYVSVASASASAVYGNSGADSIFIGGNATHIALWRCGQ